MSEHSVFAILGGATGYSFVTLKVRDALRISPPGPLAFLGQWWDAVLSAGLAVGGWFLADQVSRHLSEGAGEGVRLASLGWGLGSGFAAGKVLGIFPEGGKVAGGGYPGALVSYGDLAHLAVRSLQTPENQLPGGSAEDSPVLDLPRTPVGSGLQGLRTIRLRGRRR